ncbi:hypothetical protein ACU4GD_26155 [Cupriavidus basilensis]
MDALQLRLSGSICVGSVGIFVKSPSGTISALAVPYNSYYSTGVPEVKSYGLGSYAFHGENAAGNWEVYAVSAMPAPAAPGAMQQLSAGSRWCQRQAQQAPGC